MTYDLTSLPERDGVLDLPDDGAEAPVAGAHVSDLQAIAAELAETLAEHVDVPVPTREGWSVRCLTDVSADDLDAWRKAAKSKRHEDGINAAKLMRLVLANKVVGIIRHGVPLVDGHGEDLSFRHRGFWPLVGITRKDATASDVVKAFVVKDGAIDAMAKTVLEESGWGDDLTPDPTSADS